ncbi:uncharacterized protein MONBRDRAFT_28962 [Monosiga brevicollis MX1]|uniref:Uncharacterized protein n=1 Tax=Monosiga brevicollis TaxID=81824 RepID=A9V9P5_MONBE|nr:uncharacterized protein MONBRDRAFT_28962 [Monosiga brevicollis MX1]EDQ85757.1 predicted protein [Monosiga brevicollis MX1]|eukprot:XP_001749472.1 hypothetical protein [Monosiga brevicollis MX1]
MHERHGGAGGQHQPTSADSLTHPKVNTVFGSTPCLGCSMLLKKTLKGKAFVRTSWVYMGLSDGRSQTTSPPFNSSGDWASEEAAHVLLWLIVTQYQHSCLPDKKGSTMIWCERKMLCVGTGDPTKGFRAQLPLNLLQPEQNQPDTQDLFRPSSPRAMCAAAANPAPISPPTLADIVRHAYNKNILLTTQATTFSHARSQARRSPYSQAIPGIAAGHNGSILCYKLQQTCFWRHLQRVFFDNPHECSFYESMTVTEYEQYVQAKHRASILEAAMVVGIEATNVTEPHTDMAIPTFAAATTLDTAATAATAITTITAASPPSSRVQTNVAAATSSRSTTMNKPINVIKQNVIENYKPTIDDDDNDSIPTRLQTLVRCTPRLARHHHARQRRSFSRSRACSDDRHHLRDDSTQLAHVESVPRGNVSAQSSIGTAHASLQARSFIC